MHSSTVTFAEDNFIELIRGHLSLNQISGVIFESRELAATSNNVYLVRKGFFGFFGFDCFQNYIVFSSQCINQQIWIWLEKSNSKSYDMEQGCGVGSPVIRLRLLAISIIRLRLRLRLRLQTDSHLQLY